MGATARDEARPSPGSGGIGAGAVVIWSGSTGGRHAERFCPCQRQGDRDGGTHADGGVDLQVAAVRLGDHARDGQAQTEPVPGRPRRVERLGRLSRRGLRHPLALIHDGNPGCRSCGPLDAGELDDDRRAGGGRIARVRQQVQDGRLELRGVHEDLRRLAEPQLDQSIRTGGLLQRREPRGERLVGVDSPDARGIRASERLQLTRKANTPLEAGAGHAHDGAVGGKGVAESIDAARKYLQYVRELVSHHRSYAPQRLDIAQGLCPDPGMGRRLASEGLVGRRPVGREGLGSQAVSRRRQSQKCRQTGTCKDAASSAWQRGADAGARL